MGQSAKEPKRKAPVGRASRSIAWRAMASGTQESALATLAPPTGDPARDERVKRLMTLLEIARMLTSELDLQEIVRQVLVRAIAVIPAADAGTLYLADAASGRLLVSDSVGFGPSIFKLSLKPGEGAAGRAFASGRGAIYPDAKTVQAAVADATPETYRYFKEASDGLRSPKAAMTAPLTFKGKRLGVLVVDSMQSAGRFTADDLVMLEDFAQIAAIAIVNARLYESEHANRVRLEVLNDEITRQRDELDRRLSALDSMSQIGRQELGLAALASRLAALSSSRVYILDGLARVRAAEPARAHKEHLKELLDSRHNAELLRRAGEDHHTGAIMADGVQLVVSPIVTGADLLGYVLMEAVEPAPANVNEALAEMAALIASTVFVRERALEEGVVRGRADLLGRLLDGNVPKSAGSFEALPPPLHLAVGKLRRLDGQGGLPVDNNVLREVCTIAGRALRAQGMPAVAAIRDEYVVLAWSAAQRDIKLAATEKLEAIAAVVLESTGWRVRFSLTEMIDDLQLIPQVYQEARLAVEMRPWGEGAVVDAASLGVYRLIIGATSSRHALEFSRRTLAGVTEHDRKHKGCLVSTLRTYLEKGASLSLAAKQLGVHVHTIQYRLKKLEELTRLSLRKTEDRLTLELALRILDLASPDLTEIS